MGHDSRLAGDGGPPAALTTMHGEAPGAEVPSGAAECEEPSPGTPPLAPTDRAPEPPSSGVAAALAAERGRRQAARYGLSIQFAERPDDPELARLVESTVWINEAHAAYRRAAASRSEGYHLAVAVALALASLAVEPAKEHAFLTAFLSAWGAATDRRKRRRR
jgi:hypothetical protein